MSVAAAYAPSLARRATLSRAGYLFLSVLLILVFEGAVRKWVTNAASLPLVALRDVLALGLVVYAWQGGYFRRYKKIAAVLFAWTCLVFGWGLMQLVGGESTPVIMIIGMRFWLLYVWFAVAAAATLNEADFRAAIYVAAGLVLVMAPLAVLQHFSPIGARINKQLDGDEGVFVVVTGVVRTTGTFSFTSGYSTFLSLIAPLVFGILGAKKRTRLHHLFAIAVFVALLVGSLVSGSRTTAVSSSAMFLAYLFGRLMFSKMRQKPKAAVAVVMALVLTAIFAYVFRQSIGYTQERFEQASEMEDFLGRILTIFFGESGISNAITWLGYGVGYGSNLANFVRTGSVGFFVPAETESGRILVEGGLLGVAFIALKVILVVVGITKSIRLSAKTNSPFPMLVWLSTMVAVITWSAIGQLTSNGMLGILLAYALLVFQYPRLEIFPPRASRL
ncbi:MAG: O-antigen polysaccharide polymerase Wzy [Variovorax sp.]|nr:MAG: O-antigen polysaccharide polymerase Wzy [Variovorax sp.]